MKLQKLVYYSQSWNLVWNESPLFDNEIQAWAHGPVVRDLYDMHKHEFLIDKNKFSDANLDLLTEDEKDTIQRVVKFYGDKDPQWLSDLTHIEDPWNKARERAGLREGERGEAEITREDMFDYYVNLR